ncbi:MAG: hypothetical protein A2275_08835 [Bacteroidetes bacterium RIFOXYA12_FULL_35_11]|nr:MAG: hypothetical protein A2X01_05960 [Bacteroidetes bacterium GWF2_35_48]OFY82905.1 MAG: hypothetical protein A2275_08835 [Bacteroidetes bacterium RIFOXYA12_FULL_35_11]OFY94556.1 MAG: hypothetical protein A2309_01575 [Bacteroidetes bacterium RIFOXYB2_FULL_35_7]OFZ01859.1 MAG: hypothetical protein A2491_02295 [Bacteroidetes bacterium RIFOXYC12_FULL_35_7]HBX52783.1 hypothetical protein [Bacteroidales bacterium]
MLTLIIITSVFILIYFLYPVWLGLLNDNICAETSDRDINNISVIYLSQNGGNLLYQKLQCILNEMSAFENYEFIVIDDNSNDNSLEILKQFTNYNLNIIHNNETKGIPDSMNTGIKVAKYNNIIFCDQRQSLTPGIIKKLIEPLKYKKTGIVSACISNYDKTNQYSFIRAHENFIKQKEAKTGNLMGVYGPLYAIKKECYVEIPKNIILDDLYLTLNILPKYQVIFLEDCKIVDDSIDVLYNYKRSRRYLKGFFQLFQKNILSKLSLRQTIMLLWHKYFRLLIPLLITSCFVLVGVKCFTQLRYFILFLSMCILIFIPPLFGFNILKRLQLKSLFLISIFYSVALLDIIIAEIYFLINK